MSSVQDVVRKVMTPEELADEKAQEAYRFNVSGVVACPHVDLRGNCLHDRTHCEPDEVVAHDGQLTTKTASWCARCGQNYKEEYSVIRPWKSG